MPRSKRKPTNGEKVSRLLDDGALVGIDAPCVRTGCRRTTRILVDPLDIDPAKGHPKGLKVFCWYCKGRVSDETTWGDRDMTADVHDRPATERHVSAMRATCRTLTRAEIDALYFAGKITPISAVPKYSHLRQ